MDKFLCSECQQNTQTGCVNIPRIRHLLFTVWRNLRFAKGLVMHRPCSAIGSNTAAWRLIVQRGCTVSRKHFLLSDCPSRNCHLYDFGAGSLGVKWAWYFSRALLNANMCRVRVSGAPTGNLSTKYTVFLLYFSTGPRDNQSTTVEHVVNSDEFISLSPELLRPRYGCIGSISGAVRTARNYF